MPCGLNQTWQTEGDPGACLRRRWKQIGVKQEMAVGKKNEKCNILERQELVVQKLHMSLEVSRKAQKYTRAEPREFVQYDVEEFSIEGIIYVQTAMQQDILAIHCQI